MVAKRTVQPHDPDDELTMGEEIAPNSYSLSSEEAWRVLDYRARDYLAMSAEEFIQRLKTDDFSDEQREHVWIVRMFVPYGKLK
jgi:O6-methylguanine-DNA--protein-cysteine methyltransferase